jgi:hypothetical protein
MKKAALASLAFALSAFAAETIPTFSSDVAPILYKNCAACHRPGEIAPMSLLTYEQTRPQMDTGDRGAAWSAPGGSPCAGVHEGSEIAYVFGNFAPVMPATASDRAVSEEISSYWVNFAKTGDPNRNGLPRWPAFTNTNGQVMNLDDPSKAIDVPNLGKLEVLDGYFAWRREAAKKP